MSAIPPRPDRVLPPPPPGTPLAHVPTSPRQGSRRGLTITVAVLILFAMVAAALVPAIPRLSRSSTARSDKLYSFILEDPPGVPVRWNPCEPVHYVVNLGTAPASSLDDVHEAVRRISDATGITFVDDGATQEIPMDHRLAYQPTVYGDRWAPVLIAWVMPSQTDIPFSKNGHTAAGVASPELPDDGRERIYVSGWVAINAADPNQPGFGLYGDEGLVLQHELTHVMGLGHVKQWGELMEGSGGGVSDFGPGDLAGLRLVGRDAGCLRTPEPG